MPQSITIQDIYIYPVKSLKGIRIKTAVLEKRGLQHDRRWMLVDEKNHFLSQREISELTLFDLIQTNDGFKITHPIANNSEFILPFTIEQGKHINVTIWDDICPAIEYEEASNWFSKQLNIKCKLVYMPDTSNRYVEKEFAHNNEITSFSDGYPLLLISQESLNELNKNLTSPIEMIRFRPNIVISGSYAFEEDLWKIININKIEITVAKPCERCVIPTINPLTGKKEKKINTALSKFRMRENKIYFGQNLLPNNTGIITCGEELTKVE